MTTVYFYNQIEEDKRYKTVMQPKNVTVYFSDPRYVTIHKDEGQKHLVIIRHEKNDDWNHIKTAGFWSRYLLRKSPTIPQFQ